MAPFLINVTDKEMQQNVCEAGKCGTERMVSESLSPGFRCSIQLIVETMAYVYLFFIVC